MFVEEDFLGFNCYYDKFKLFFDNIFFEFKISFRWMMWVEERKFNIEIFGVLGRFFCGCSFWGGF